MSKLSVKTNKLLKKILLFSVICFGLVFLLVNIFLSQLIPTLYFHLIKNDKEAIVTFLTKIKKTSDFTSYMNINTQIYGESIRRDVFDIDQKRLAKIKSLELLLQKYPDSRDVLYDLYLLYHEQGNALKAENYLKKTLIIDPAIQRL